MILRRHGYVYDSAKAECHLIGPVHWAHVERAADRFWPASRWPFLEVYRNGDGAEGERGVLRTVDRRQA